MAEGLSDGGGCMRERLIKILAVVLVFCVIQLPVNHLFGYLLLLIAATVIFVGIVTTDRRRIAAALGITLAVIVIKVVAAPPKIDEGHNVFVVDTTRPPGVLETGLPPAVFNFMLGEFERVYPPTNWCDQRRQGCWRFDAPTTRTYAFSGDGIYDRAPYSRRVEHIEIDNPQWWRTGFVNERKYDWYNKYSDVIRSYWYAHGWNKRVRWEIKFPWFTMFRFPSDFAGSELCWRGTVLWEGAGESFTTLQHADIACRTIEAGDAGRRIFAVSIDPDAPLAMRLHPTWPVWSLRAVSAAATLIGVIGVLLLLVRVRPRDLVLPVIVLGAAATVVVLLDPIFFGGFHVYAAGDDGLTHEGFARAIWEHLSRGEVVAALRGGEPVFWFTPGMRYLRTLDKLIFGDTNFAYLSALLITPALLLALVWRFTSLGWALAILVLFTISMRTGLDFNFGEMVKIASYGYPDTAGVIAFVGGLLLIVGRTDRGGGAAAGLGGALLLALSAFLRPNLFPMAVVVVLGGAAVAAYEKRPARAASLCLGFSAMGVMALHNWVFGGVFVPFGSNVALPEVLIVTPRTYLAAALDLFRLDFGSEPLAQIALHVSNWIGGLRPKWSAVILHVAEILILIHVVILGHRQSIWLRIIALAALAGHSVAMFYVNTPRYHFLTWILTVVVATVWLRNEALLWLRRMLPSWAAWWDAQPLRQRIVDRWTRIEQGVLSRP
jgi:hypothetical protein